METKQATCFGQAIHTVQSRQIGALPVLQPILSALQVRETGNALAPSQADIDLGQIVVLLVLNRLLAPRPLAGMQDWFAGTVLPEVLDIAVAQIYDNRLGRALDQLYPCLGELWRRLVSRAITVYDLDLTVLHWDLTSIYFEGAYVDSELVTYGYSRDQRPDAKQINLQVDVTHEDSVPVLYQILTGNTADITRPLPHLTALAHFLTRPELAERHLRPLLVSDCKLLTPAAVFECHQRQFFYLAPLPDGVAVTALLRSVPAAELAAHPLNYRPQRVAATSPFVPYQGVWRPFTFEADGARITDRVLVVWSDGKQRLDQQKRRTYLKRLLNGLEAVQHKLNTRRYKQRAYVEQRLAALKQGNPTHALVDVGLTGDDGALQLTFAIHRSRLAAAQALDGRYALATNATHLTADETLTLFKGQDRVEKRFRVVKGPLAVHPLFVHSDRRIEGLVCITLIALLVRAILERLGRQHGLPYTAERLIHGFASLQAVDLLWADGSVQRQAAELSTLQAEVLQTLDWPFPATYAQLKTLPAAAHR